MYCPKCGQNFEEGSRRFCPTDGARLVPEDGGNAARGEGVFANLIPKMGAIADLEEVVPETAKPNEPVPAAPIPTMPVTPESEPFFELDVMDEEPGLEKIERLFEQPAEQPETDFQPVQRPDRSDLPPIAPPLFAPEAPVFTIEPQAAAPKPQIFAPPPQTTRKVDPNNIPAGHVDLGDGYKASNFAADFDFRDPDIFVGQTVKGRYKVVEFLGGDELGLAYVADDRILEDKKVLVRILASENADEITDNMLAEERVSLSHFSHPNIARLIDSGQFTNGTHFLISEFIDALSVNDILSIHGQFAEQRAARIIKQAASALNEAHQEGILHRDIRAENIIIDATDGDAGNTKLVNFGASDGRPTASNMPYKAPEVLDGRASTVSSDIFSLGVVAFEMLTGAMPFSGKNAKEMMRSQLAGPAAMPSEVRPELSSAVDEVFAKALAPKVVDRYVKARDFGDALQSALTMPVATNPVAVRAKSDPTTNTVVIEPEKPSTATVEKAPPQATEPWRNRSTEPPQEGSSRLYKLFAVGIGALLLLLAVGWYFLVHQPASSDIPAQGAIPANSETMNTISPIVSEVEMPPLARSIQQPPDTNFYQTTKQNLKGDLLLNFVGFTMYYPKSWKVTGPQPGTSATSRGKFIDISRQTPDGRMQEQMLISYYPSKGTYNADAEKFPQMVKEANETLKTLLPGYQMVSEGEIKLNGDWRAYEVKFQGEGTSPSGETLKVWGRRMFVPAARPGVKSGFEITMLATSLANEVTAVDDVGVKGELARVLNTFEPNQNF